jgi:hypothetical protein
MRDSRRRALLFLLGWGAAVACGSSPTSQSRPVVSGLLGPAGGQLSAASGRIKLQIPAGALASTMSFTIQEIDPPIGGAVGGVFEVGPTGTRFLLPVTLALAYTNAALGSANAQDLHVATLSRGAWVPVSSRVNLSGNLVNGQITHLSTWTLIPYTDVVPPEPDASVPDDNDGAAGQGGGPGDDGGSDDTAFADAAPDGAADSSGAAGATGDDAGAPPDLDADASES